MDRGTSMLIPIVGQKGICVQETFVNGSADTAAGSDKKSVLFMKLQG